MRRLPRALPWTLALALVCAAPAVAPAQPSGTVLTPKQRERERKGFAAFAATRYQEALEIYAELYADFHDPIYLRNIGRCHYKLRHPDEAISSFEEYLLKFKRISPDERAEVDGWIKDMRELQKPAAPAPSTPTTSAPATVPSGTASAPPGTGAPPPPAAPAITPTAVAAARPAPALHVTQPAPAPADDNAGVRHLGVGALVLGGALAAVGGVFAATSWSKYGSAKNGACLTTSEGCSKAADTIEQRATLSKLFLVGGVAAGLAGGALIIFFPPAGPGHTALVGTSGTF